MKHSSNMQIRHVPYVNDAGVDAGKAWSGLAKGFGHAA
jgi:hypothetical protein